MRFFSCKSVFALAAFGLLSTMAALVWFSDPGTVDAQSSQPFIVEGKVIINGRPAPDGSYIIAYIDGRDVAEAQTQGGTFVMAIPQQPGQSLTGRAIEFAGKGSGGTLFDFAQKSVWSPGGRANLRLELNTDSGFGGNQPTTFVPPFVVQGKVVIDGNIVPDGTLIAAYVFGSRIHEEAHVGGGRFELKIPQSDGPRFDGQIIEFQALFPDGRHVDFPQTLHWQAGGFGTIALEIGQFREEPTSPFGISIPQIPQIPDGLDVGCVLGRIPSSPQDMTPQESLRVARECFSGGGFQDDSARRAEDDAARRELEQLQFEQEKQRLEQELAFQQEQQRLETQRLRQDQAFQEEQQRLDQQQRVREQDRIKREQALQDEQDRLNRDRLKSERERQQEQARLDQERFRQEQERFQAEQEMQADQQRLDQRRALEDQQRQDELEKARFESERARIDRERSLEEERARLDQERLRRDEERFRQEAQFNQNRQGQDPGGQTSEAGGPGQQSGDAKVNTGPARGFFTNSQIGQLGSLNNFLDPATLAVIGILLTLVASTLQLVKGN